MSSLVKSESVTLLSAVESSLGTQPTSGWRQHQPNDIQDFIPKIKKVARNPLSKNRQNEKGDVVDLDTTPKMVHDLNKDLLDYLSEGIMLSATKHGGNKGASYYTPTAVTSTGYTVAALGDLTARTLIRARGFSISGNNGLKMVGSSSTGTETKTSGLTAETVSGYLATVEVAGWRGASGDIQLDSSGNLTSTLADFTTMGLVVGQWIWVGGTAGTATAFATAAYRGFAQISVIAAAKLTLVRRSWVVSTADDGSAKTIDLYFTKWLRNVAIDHADYSQPSYTLELSLPGAAAAAATDYKYAAGCMVDSFEVMSPLTDKITTTTGFCGTSMGDPTTTRATGGSTASAPLATAATNSVSEELYIKVLDAADESSICVDIASWKLTLQNNITPQKQQGTFGAARMIVGKCIVGIDLEAYYVQDDVEKAIRDNRTLMFGAGLRNNDGGVFFDVPSLTFSDGALKIQANGAVMLSPKCEGFRDATRSYTLGMSLFAYLPSS